MPRYKLTIEYDGTPFCGWQRQDGQPSVQASLEDAISRLGETDVTLFGAGRTDTGVHALGQVAHVDLEKDWTADKLMGAINAQVRPDPVSVLDVTLVDDAFHARFSATARHYRFRILDRRPPPALDRNRVWWVPHALDAQAMHEAAQTLVGHHDFHDLPLGPVPVKVAGQDARPARRGARGRRDCRLRFGAIVPAQSGAIIGRYAEAGR
jgi:tRNA pseudouridine38-40 synthase